MKYSIKQKKLPFSEEHHDFTLVIHLGIVKGEMESYDARLQFPAESYRDGLALYRQFVQDQKEHLGNTQIRRRTTSVKRQKQRSQQAIAYN
ncbi:MAG: hypothetical protein AAGA75_05835 [Cyanobacteria bacterium P01_E01_bin.6]